MVVFVVVVAVVVVFTNVVAFAVVKAAGAVFDEAKVDHFAQEWVGLHVANVGVVGVVKVFQCGEILVDGFGVMLDGFKLKQRFFAMTGGVVCFDQTLLGQPLKGDCSVLVFAGSCLLLFAMLIGCFGQCHGLNGVLTEQLKLVVPITFAKLFGHFGGLIADAALVFVEVAGQHHSVVFQFGPQFGDVGVAVMNGDAVAVANQGDVAFNFFAVGLGLCFVILGHQRLNGARGFFGDLFFGCQCV